MASWYRGLATLREDPLSNVLGRTWETAYERCLRASTAIFVTRLASRPLPPPPGSPERKRRGQPISQRDQESWRLSGERTEMGARTDAGPASEEREDMGLRTESGARDESGPRTESGERVDRGPRVDMGARTDRGPGSEARLDRGARVDSGPASDGRADGENIIITGHAQCACTAGLFDAIARRS
jgi:hypothetical protein